MKDITIIIPIHKYDDTVRKYLTRAIKSVKDCHEFYKDGDILLSIVAPENVINSLCSHNISELYKIDFIKNDGKTDFCSQINRAVEEVKTDYFSILEFDDVYNKKWFKMVSEYYEGNESVSVFLPINVATDTNETMHQFINEIAWTGSFTNEIGFLDFECLQDYSAFNLTGGVFNTNDFKMVGGFKPSIKVAFNYEFLLRATKKELKVFVIPKEGYAHTLGRVDSLMDEYNNTLNAEEIRKWFNLAKTEYTFVEDRGTNIDKIKEEVLS